MSSPTAEQFLGMAPTKAKARLVRMILLHLAQKCGMDRCFVCNETINSVSELSIEHKVPWLGRSVEAFWDLENIAFSHLKCNRPHTYRGQVLQERKLEPGHFWCNSCKTSKLAKEFYKNRTKANGLSTECKECVKSRLKKFRKRHPNYRKNWGTKKPNP